MKKTYFFLGFFVFITVVCNKRIYAQQWDGPINSVDLIHRTGPIQTGNSTIVRASSPGLTLLRNDQNIGNGAVLSQINFTGPNLRFGGLIVARAVGNWGPNINQSGTKIEFWTQDNTTNANIRKRMVIDHNGKVGIGQEFPVSQLDLFEGPISIRRSGRLPRGNINAAEKLRMTGVTSDYIISLQDGTGRVQHYWNASVNPSKYLVSNEAAGKISFHPAGGRIYDIFYAPPGQQGANINWTSYFTVRNNGNIGIGTTNPGDFKLAVNGVMRAKEIVVESGWSDFVFEKDYDLPSLEEVALFIKEKGHLPDIPSAEEVATHGVSVGEMESKLLQKIEELTLYLLELDAKNKSLKSEIDELKRVRNIH